MDDKAGSRGSAPLSVGRAPRITTLLQRRNPETSKVHQYHSKSSQGSSFGFSHKIQEFQIPTSQTWVSPQQTDKSRLGFPEKLNLRLQKAGGLGGIALSGTLKGEFPSTHLKTSLYLFLLEECSSIRRTQLKKENSVKKWGEKEKRKKKRMRKEMS